MRLTIRRAMVIVGVVAVLCAVILVPLIKAIERRKKETVEYHQIAHALFEAIRDLGTHVPAGVAPEQWKPAVEATAVAHFNSCYAWHHPPIGEMRCLRDEAMAKLRGPVSAETLTWFWERLGRTGVDGKRYTDANRPDFSKCLPGSGFQGERNGDATRE